MEHFINEEVTDQQEVVREMYDLLSDLQSTVEQLHCMIRRHAPDVYATFYENEYKGLLKLIGDEHELGWSERGVLRYIEHVEVQSL